MGNFVEREVGLSIITSAVAVGVAKHIGETMSDIPPSIAGALKYNSQDFLIYGAPLFTDLLIRFGFPRVNNTTVRLVSATAAAAFLFFTEVAEKPDFLNKFLGTPDIADIPAGLLGIAAYLGMSLWLDRYFPKRRVPSLTYTRI